MNPIFDVRTEISAPSLRILEEVYSRYLPLCPRVIVYREGPCLGMTVALLRARPVATWVMKVRTSMPQCDAYAARQIRLRMAEWLNRQLER